MTVTIASEPRPGKKRNEDLALFLDGFAAVLDGASLPREARCGHDSAWYVRVLARHLVDARSEDPLAGLRELLREAIRRAGQEHAEGCARTGKPLSGAATVVLARHDRDHLDYLVLCDSAVIIDEPGGPRVATDDRVSGLPLESATRIRRLLAAGGGYGEEYQSLLREQVRELSGYRNVRGGYWIAADEPAAADHAIAGTAPLTDVALVTDGVSRAVTSLGVYSDWATLLCALRESGPGAVIAAVRRAERDDPDGLRCPRGSPHDDATALLWQP